jgi:hypothetical protein
MGEDEDNYKRFEESAELVDKAFRQFRAQQTTHGGKVTHKDKLDLRQRLAELDAQLDLILAGEYGITPKSCGSKASYEQAFIKWKDSHQPFHWFVEFYGIMSGGGFDVIIGNPPYVEYDRKLQSHYTVRGYGTTACGNLHAFVAERSISLQNKSGRIGLIVPLPSINTSRMECLQRVVKPSQDIGRSVWVSAFDERPSNLFSGVDQRLVIEVFGALCESPALITTGINRWQSKCRDVLFPTITYAIQHRSATGLTDSILKIKEAKLETAILQSFYSNKPIENYRSSALTGHVLAYRTAGGRYWKIALDRPFDSNSLSNKTADIRGVTGRQAAALLMSSTFWWYYSMHFDMYNLKDYMIFGFRFSDPSKSVLDKLEHLGAELQKSLRRNSVEQTVHSRTRGDVTSRLYVGSQSKPVIDQIDKVLAKHYGFTDEELDFIINYDIKYRMGNADDETGDDE